jgi:hypothetical protein
VLRDACVPRKPIGRIEHRAGHTCHGKAIFYFLGQKNPLSRLASPAFEFEVVLTPRTLRAASCFHNTQCNGDPQEEKSWGNAIKVRERKMEDLSTWDEGWLGQGGNGVTVAFSRALGSGVLLKCLFARCASAALHCSFLSCVEPCGMADGRNITGI